MRRAGKWRGDMTDNMMDAVGLWRRLVDEWRRQYAAARGPIEAAFLGAQLPEALYKVGYYIAGVAERRGIDATALLAFNNRPDAGERLDAALVVIQRIALAVGSQDAAATPAGPAAPSPQWLTLEHAAKLVPGGRSHSTLWKWCKEGVNGVYLEHRRYGNTIYVTRQAVEQFGEKRAQAGRTETADHAAVSVAPSSVKSRRPRGERKELERARRTLEAAGIRAPFAE